LWKPLCFSQQAGLAGNYCNLNECVLNQLRLKNPLLHKKKHPIMTSRFKILLTLALTGIITASCEEEDLEDAGAESQALVSQAAADNLILAETFETPSPWRTAHGTEFGMEHSFSVVANPVFDGAKVARFELKDSDPIVSGGTRAEVTIVKDKVEKEMWYSFAARFPANEFLKDSEKEIINQWWQTGDKHLGEGNTSPATALYIEDDRFIFDTGYNDAQVSTGVLPESRRKIDLGPVSKDTWHQFVFHFIHSYQSDGLIEVWHNGNKLLSHPGGNMYNNVALPKWKLGIYKWKWNGGGTTDTRKRVVYYDNIKVGNAQATLQEMMPGATPPPIEADPDSTSGSDPEPTPEPTPEPAPGGTSTLSSLTLVNAHTDTDVRKLQDGDSFSLSELGTSRLTIRADVGPNPIVGVMFVLSGMQRHTNVDKVKPYALYGDDGNGNLYFGNSLPVGTYTLVATPFTYSKGTSKLMGMPISVRFSIKK
jgi:hypothetical protein